MVFGGFTMRLSPKVLSCLFVLQASFTILPKQIKADTKDAGEPQMVWITYAQGEVKFSPGQNGEAKLGKDWVEANRGQVLENGYTLVTENGRAEIEFEDGSTAYLAEHSTLVFNWLWVNGKGTDTELNLLTGKMTVAHEAASEQGTLNRFFVGTPAFGLHMVRRQRTTVESAVDGSVFEAVERTQMIEQSSVFGVLKQGEAIAYVKGQPPTLLPAAQRTPEQEEWYQWVTARLDAHRALVAEGLKESGMKEPVPGLAGMVEAGHFYDCPPNGKCWEPNAAAGPPVGYLPPQGASPASGAPQAFAGDAAGEIESPSSAASKQGTILVNQTMMTRCPMETWQSKAQNTAPAQYGTCMAGTWNTSPWDPNDPCLRRDPVTRKVRYRPECDFYSYNTWVAGRRHHHECRFVKVKGHGIGFVPRHAADVKGHPVNAKSGIFVLAAEKGHVQAGVEAEPSKGVHEVANVPQGLAREFAQSTPHVAQPTIEGRTASAILPKGTLVSSHASTVKNVSAIRFDYKSGNFVGRTGEGAGAHSVVVAHTGGSGGISGGGSHGSSGGSSSGGGSSGGHSGGGSSSGGASAGGGGHH
jgi:hypothetical protein